MYGARCHNGGCCGCRRGRDGGCRRGEEGRTEEDTAGAATREDGRGVPHSCAPTRIFH